MNRSAASPNQYEGGGTKTVSMFSKLVSQGSSFVMEGVKNLVVKKHVSNSKLCWSFSFLIHNKFKIFKNKKKMNRIYQLLKLLSN